MRGRLPSAKHTIEPVMEYGRELIICSDGIDEIVNAFNVDILDNDPNN